MVVNLAEVSINQDATRAFIQVTQTSTLDKSSPFEEAKHVARFLGGQWIEERARFGVWLPNETAVYIELLRPTTSINLSAEQQTVQFERRRLPLISDESYWWGIIEGLRPGSREQLGDFYRFAHRLADGTWHYMNDPLAYSLPYGAFAPAELYDFEGMQSKRGDKAHFQNHLDGKPDPDGIQRVQPPTNILQIHTRTASGVGTIAGLTEIYGRIAQKIQNSHPLTPAEENYASYDAIQLMPIEPIIELEAGPLFWEEQESSDEELTASLTQPSMTNWGYDVVMLGSSATNPAVLGSKRPDELLDLIVTLHNFPEKPIKVLFDIVYGHIDNQAIGLLNEHFFAGANMYGQNVNFLHPVVRAMLLEMQRRKHNYGVDGVRVDGAQDFKNWDPETDTMWHDDDYLRLMNDLEQEVAGVTYRPYMIFEDGRPWPRDDWELSSTYREVTKQMPNVWQWGPLTFAHNTPFLFTFWISKWWRIQEITQVGGRWITGCANHDTLRRGTQVLLDARINTYLGDTLPEIFMNAYDNPAAKLFDYAMMPGIPMDFINASMRAPWSFVRNTDDRYGVKVVSEESRFLHWVVNQERFEPEWAFTRLKNLGFTKLGALRRFLHSLEHTVLATGYDLDVIAAMMNNITPPLAGSKLDVPTLKQIARAWMDDVHEFCNVSHYVQHLDPQKTAFNRQLREFRRQRQWLQNDFSSKDYFDYLRPVDGSVIFFGLRTSPTDDEQFLFVANLEGAPHTVEPLALPMDGLEGDQWQVALASPGLEGVDVKRPLTLHDSQGVVFRRESLIR